MSLKVWLPLDGSLENKGLANAIITNSETNPVTFKNDGKIGKCANGGQFTLDKNYLGMIGSICFWIYVDENTNANIIYGNDINNIDDRKWSLFLYPNRNSLHSWGCQKDNSSTTNGSFVIINVIPDNKWTHVCVVHDLQNQYIYINGILHSTVAWDSSGTFTFDVETPVIVPQNGCLNDLRLYDHCLSAKEVKEMSKALIAHYKLDNSSPAGVENDCSGYGRDGTKNNIAYSSDSPRYKGSSVFSADSKSSILLPADLIPKDYSTNEFSISCWFNLDGSFEPTQPNLIVLRNDFFRILTGKSYKTITICLNHSISEYKNSISTFTLETQMTKDEWHFLTSVFKDGNIYCYYDGNLVGLQSCNDSDSKICMYYVGGNKNNTIGAQIVYEEFFNGSISDVRIYATALSDKDIKELYQTSVSIDNKGNLWAYGFSVGDKVNINKNGIATAPQFIENESKCRIGNNFIAANQFIKI